MDERHDTTLQRLNRHSSLPVIDSFIIKAGVTFVKKKETRRGAMDEIQQRNRHAMVTDEVKKYDSYVIDVISVGNHILLLEREKK